MKEIFESWLKGLSTPNKPDEFEVKQLFKEYGINVPNGVRLTPNCSTENVDLNFPCVVKVCDPNILHKTDCGGLYFNVDKESLPRVIEELKNKFPNSNYLVEEQVKDLGTEFIIGALVDPVFGPAIMFGAGGILTELYKDVTFRLAPCSVNEAEKMLRELTISELFNGYRGKTLDIKTLADTLSKISNLVVMMGEHFNQLDINPIIFCDNKWIALDGVLILN